MICPYPLSRAAKISSPDFRNIEDGWRRTTRRVLVAWDPVGLALCGDCFLNHPARSRAMVRGSESGAPNGAYRFIFGCRSWNPFGWRDGCVGDAGHAPDLAAFAAGPAAPVVGRRKV